MQIPLLLLNAGADVDAQDFGGRTAISVAVEYKRKELIEKLLRRGARLDLLDGVGRSPLWYAVAQGDQQLVLKLLEAGAPATSPPDLLHVAAAPRERYVYRANRQRFDRIDRFVAIAKLLLDRGADVNRRNRQGWTPLGLALAHDAEPLAQLFRARGAEPGPYAPDLPVRLRIAVAAGDLEAVRHILDVEPGALLLPVSYEETNFSGEPQTVWCHALHIAARERRWAVMRLLLERGAPLDVRDRHDRTALQFVARVGRVSIARTLLDLGADENTMGWWEGEQRAALHLAVRHGHRALVALLLARGLPTDPAHPVIRRAVILAAHHGDSAMMRILLGQCAAPQPGSGLGWLLTPEAVDAAIIPALRRRSPAVLNVLLAHGARLDQPGFRGWTPLHAAAKAGDRRMLTLLLDTRVPLDPRDIRGWTPLHVAAAHRDPVTTRFLLENGADATAADKDGKSPLHHLVSAVLPDVPDDRHAQRARDTALLLRRAGCDPLLADIKGETPLSLARSAGMDRLL